MATQDNRTPKIRRKSAADPTYSFQILDDGYRPRIRPGEFVVCSPSLPLAPGDEVLVTTVDGKHEVREFLSRRGGFIELGDINGKAHGTSIAENLVASMHLVVSRLMTPAAARGLAGKLSRE